MRAAVATLLYTAWAFSSAAAAQTALPTQSAPQWLKLYHMSPIREIWSSDVKVKSLAKDFQKVLDAIQKNGGKLTQPLETFGASQTSRQVSFSISKAGAKKALKAIKKTGRTGEPRVNLPPEVVDLEEVRAKIATLTKERTERAAEFEKLPATAELVEELLARLARVEGAQRTESEVLWNVSVSEGK